MVNYKLKIKEIRKVKGITAKELANKIGISQSYLSDLENQKYNIKLFRILEIAVALNVCYCELITLPCTRKCNRNCSKYFFS